MIRIQATPNGQIRLTRPEGGGDGSGGETDRPFDALLTPEEAWSLVEDHRLHNAVHEARRVASDARRQAIARLKDQLARLEREDQLARSFPARQGVPR
jgi:hypothetical protein